MKLRFRCPSCRRVLVADDRYAGAAFKCPRCRNAVRVPRPDEQKAVQARPATEDEAPSQVKFAAKGASDDEIDMTPMIDCVFLLLIFFLVTATFAMQKSLEIPPPERSETSARQARTIEELEADSDYVVVRVESDNTIFVEDSAAPSKQELLIKLREARNRQGSDGRSPTSLLVLASGEAQHDTVVMALDAGNGVGMENVRLATVSDEDF